MTVSYYGSILLEGQFLPVRSGSFCYNIGRREYREQVEEDMQVVGRCFRVDAALKEAQKMA